MASPPTDDTCKANPSLILSDGLSTFVPQECYPSFSWDETPQYIHFRALHTLPPDLLKSVASKSNFITLEKAYANRQFVNGEEGTKHEAANFHETNPKMKVMFYFNAAYVYRDTSYCKQFAPDEIDQHPFLKSLLLKDKDSETGEPYHLPPPRNLFCYDCCNPETRKWWVDTVAKGLADTNCDGVFIDQMHGCVFLRPGGPKIRAEVLAAQGQMMETLKAKLGPDKLIVGNNAQLPEVFPHVDAIMFEHYRKELLSKENLLGEWNEMLRIAEANKISVFRIGIEQCPCSRKGTEGLQQHALDCLEFYLAVFLIGAQPYSYFMHGWGWQDPPLACDFAILNNPLGAPKGVYQRTEPDGWEFTRKFEYASVWVNTDIREAKITWQRQP